jgi:pSer/pThr/pTyr-binding forkhead associated (FHA) protein
VWVVALLAVLILLFLRVRRRRRLASSPPLTSSIPFLKSSDGSLYFRLDRLDRKGLIIGRAKQGVDLRIEESTPYADTVSNQHARIYYDDRYGHVIIEDLDSMNGVFINGRQAPPKNLLKDEWVIGLGSVTLTYHAGESDTGPLD